jgi:hypothetical protein
VTKIILPEKRVSALGLDLGRDGEPTGVCLLRRMPPKEYDSYWNCPGHLQMYEVPYLHSFPTGTSLDKMVKEIARVLSEAANPSSGEREEIAAGRYRQVQTNIQFVVNLTAVGAPIAKELTRMLQKDSCKVEITTGLRESYEDGIYRVPRLNIIGEIGMSLQLDRLTIAARSGATERLRRELANYKDRPKSEAFLSGETWREIPSDDLVFAMGIAIWRLQNLFFPEVEFI